VVRGATHGQLVSPRERACRFALACCSSCPSLLLCCACLPVCFFVCAEEGRRAASHPRPVWLDRARKEQQHSSHAQGKHRRDKQERAAEDRRRKRGARDWSDWRGASINGRPLCTGRSTPRPRHLGCVPVGGPVSSNGVSVRLLI
jgi:hypothetical protein